MTKWAREIINNKKKQKKRKVGAYHVVTLTRTYAKHETGAPPPALFFLKLKSSVVPAEQGGNGVMKNVCVCVWEGLLGYFVWRLARETERSGRICMYMCVYVCICVYEKEREREGGKGKRGETESEKKTDGEKERERERNGKLECRVSERIRRDVTWESVTRGRLIITRDHHRALAQRPDSFNIADLAVAAAAVSLSLSLSPRTVSLSRETENGRPFMARWHTHTHSHSRTQRPLTFFLLYLFFLTIHHYHHFRRSSRERERAHMIHHNPSNLLTYLLTYCPPLLFASHARLAGTRSATSTRRFARCSASDLRKIKCATHTRRQKKGGRGWRCMPGDFQQTHKKKIHKHTQTNTYLTSLSKQSPASSLLSLFPSLLPHRK